MSWGIHKRFKPIQWTQGKESQTSWHCVRNIFPTFYISNNNVSHSTIIKCNENIKPFIALGHAKEFFSEETAREKVLFDKVLKFVNADVDKDTYFTNIFTKCDIEKLNEKLADAEFCKASLTELIDIRKNKLEYISLCDVLTPVCEAGDA